MGTGGAGDLYGAVGGVVVIDVDGGVRELPLECSDDLADGGLFVVAGDEDGERG